VPDAIAAQGLTYRRGDRLVVDHIQFSVSQGDRYALVGQAGSGQTATVRMLATILTPSNGTALVADADILEEPRRVRSRIGFVEPSVKMARPDWRPWPFLKYWGRLQGLSASEVREEAGGLLEHFVRPSLHGEPVGDFPTPQKRRLHVARALLHDPDVLLLDDPTRGWDLVEQQRLWDDLDAILSDRDCTLLVATQDAAEVQALCDRVGALADAEIAFEGPLEAVPGEGDLGRRLATVIRAEAGGSL
jgi:ABC-2 type transport system ATP-binding protein